MAVKHLLVLFGALIAGPVYAGPQSPEVAVVAVYEGMASYTDAVAANPSVDRGALWREKVMNPYWQIFPAPMGRVTVKVEPPVSGAVVSPTNAYPGANSLITATAEYGLTRVLLNTFPVNVTVCPAKAVPTST